MFLTEIPNRKYQRSVIIINFTEEGGAYGCACDYVAYKRFAFKRRMKTSFSRTWVPVINPSIYVRVIRLGLWPILSDELRSRIEFLGGFPGVE